MTELYCIIDNRLCVDIKKLPVVEVIDTPSRIPGSPSDGLPAKEAYVESEGDTRRVILGVDASEDPNTALRLAFRVIERYISDATLHVLERHRHCTELDQDRLNLKEAAEALEATLIQAAAHVDELVCYVLNH